MTPFHRTLALLLALVGGLASRAAGADPAGFAFLEVPAGARASALGGAYTSMAQGAEAVFWNPSGLGALRGLELGASHVELFEGLRDDQFVIAGRRLGGGLAASVRAQYTDPIVERDVLGNEIGTFGAHDLEFALAYGRSVGARLSLGGAAKYVRERIANSSAATYAFDVGAGWEPGPPGLKLGFVGQHLGPAASFTLDGTEGAPVPLPAAVQGGASYARALGTTLTLRGAVEGRLTRGRAGVGIVGAELAAPGAGAALRLGWRVNDDATALGAGAGYALRGLNVDYAFVPFRDDLGDTHRFSLSLRF